MSAESLILIVGSKAKYYCTFLLVQDSILDYRDESLLKAYVYVEGGVIMQNKSGILANKKALIVGVANDRSIATGIADAMHRQGAELAFSYVNDRLKSRVEKVAERLNSSIVLPCDVSEDSQIESLFSELKTHWPTFDILVHAVAFAPSDQISGKFLDSINREGFQITHDISSYSLAALTKAAEPMLTASAAIMALTYIGSTQAIPFYNTMGLAKASLEANVRYLSLHLGEKGIRVNAISAGPIKTLSGAGIKGFRSMLNQVAQITPLKRNVNLEDIGNASAFICSDLASGITGEILHVDNGYHAIGLTEA